LAVRANGKLYSTAAKRRGGRGARKTGNTDHDMMRPLPFAVCLALAAAIPMAALTAPQQPAPASSSAPAATAPAATAPAAPATPVGNPDAGRILSYTCQGCHGVTGYKNAYPNYHVPKIGGQSAEYLTQALTEYKQGKRKHPTMQSQSQSFSEQDIADLAAYLSSLK
jgi:cytochrome c553